MRQPRELKTIRQNRNKTPAVVDPYISVLASRRETESFGMAIGRLLQGGQVLALLGELGAGKTTLVRGLVAGLEAPASSVSSPTFTLVHEYSGRLRFMHLDLYRLRTADEAESIGLSECFDDDAVTAIEWADRFPSLLPADRLIIRLTHQSTTTRMVTLEAKGTQSCSLLARIQAIWHPSQSPSHLTRPRRRKATHQ